MNICNIIYFKLDTRVTRSFIHLWYLRIVPCHVLPQFHLIFAYRWTIPTFMLILERVKII